MNARYFAYNGMDETPIQADSIMAVDDAGNKYELHWRTIDKEMSLSVGGSGSIVIKPRASNVVRLSVDR